MRILAATATGLAAVDDDGHVEWMLKGDVTAVHDGWAIVDRTTVVRVDDPATRITLPWPAHCLASVAGHLLCGTAEAHVVSVAPGASAATPVDSFERIPSRAEWYTPWGGPPDTRSLTVTEAGTPLVNVHVGGVWRGEGRAWAEVIAVDADTHQVLAADGVVVVAAAVGFAISDDDGRTFAWTTAGLHASYCRAVAVADDNVLVTASTGPYTQHGAVYLRPRDSEGPFLRCDNGLPEWFAGNIDTFQLHASGPDAAIGTDDGRLYVSDDSGCSWGVLAEGLDAVRGVTVVA